MAISRMLMSGGCRLEAGSALAHCAALRAAPIWAMLLILYLFPEVIYQHSKQNNTTKVIRSAPKELAKLCLIART
jgi:hypothetical protein